MTDQEKLERKRQQNREYRERKRAGIAWEPKKVSVAFLAKQTLKNNKRNATKKEDFNPKAYVRKLETNRKSRERRKLANPEAYTEKNRTIAKEYYAKLTEDQRYKKNRDKRLSRLRNPVIRVRSESAKPFAPSVAHAAAPSQWRDLIFNVGKMVGICNEREDIISEAILLHIEGLTLTEAVAKAKHTVNYQTNAVHRILPIESDKGYEPSESQVIWNNI